MGRSSTNRKKDSIKYISVLVPVYKGAHVLSGALKSITRQTNKNYEVIVGDDNPPDLKEEIERTKQVIAKFPELKIRYIKNKKNLGCHKNFEEMIRHAKYDIVFFLAQDDIFSRNAVQIVFDVFNNNEEVGLMTRPYYWYEDDIKKPIRHVPPLNPDKNEVISIYDGERSIKAIFGSVGQISGLAIRKSTIRIPYHTDIFPGHIYPMADLLINNKCVFIKDYNVAVGTVDSQSRHITAIYDESPTEEWMRMFRRIYKGKEFDEVRKQCIKHMATNFEGLVQIKNYGKPGKAEREVFILLKYRWQNIFEPKFWLYSIVTILTPRMILRKLTDYYKRNILSKSIPEIKFKM